MLFSRIETLLHCNFGGGDAGQGGGGDDGFGGNDTGLGGDAFGGFSTGGGSIGGGSLSDGSAGVGAGDSDGDSFGSADYDAFSDPDSWSEVSGWDVSSPEGLVGHMDVAILEDFYNQDPQDFGKDFKDIENDPLWGMGYALEHGQFSINMEAFFGQSLSDIYNYVDVSINNRAGMAGVVDQVVSKGLIGITSKAVGLTAAQVVNSFVPGLGFVAGKYAEGRVAEALQYGMIADVLGIDLGPGAISGIGVIDGPHDTEIDYSFKASEIISARQEQYVFGNKPIVADEEDEVKNYLISSALFDLVKYKIPTALKFFGGLISTRLQDDFDSLIEDVSSPKLVEDRKAPEFQEPEMDDFLSNQKTSGKLF